MNTKLAILIPALLFAGLAQSDAPAEIHGPQYSGEQMLKPENYREWVYLTSGFDMSYRAVAMPGHHMFDNVFAEPAANQSFLKNGTWPDKNVLVLEVRGAEG